MPPSENTFGIRYKSPLLKRGLRGIIEPVMNLPCPPLRTGGRTPELIAIVILKHHFNELRVEL